MFGQKKKKKKAFFLAKLAWLVAHPFIIIIIYY